MKLPLLSACGAFAALLPAQGHLSLPGTANTTFELPSYSLLPFMQPNARVQMFYDADEVGPLPFLADQLELRYDGPIPQVGAPGPFTVQQLTIKVGTTSVTMPGADFAANLTQPLTTVFDGTWNYQPDPGSAFPHPWGAPNGSLTFPFSAPVPLFVPPGEWLVVELTMVGNNIASFGFSHAILDGETTTGGITNGTTAAYGQGCSAAVGQPAATATTNGTYAPGAVHWLTGQNLGANTFAVGIYGLSDQMSFVPLPWTLPGSACDLLASLDFTKVAVTDASGTITTGGLFLNLPPDPALDGLQLFEQIASLVPSANPFGLVTSNAVAVTLGVLAPLGRGTYTVAHDTDAGAQLANKTEPFGYAMRLRTL